MKLSHNSIAKLIHGAYTINKLDNGYTGFFHFTDSQVQVLKKRDNFFYERAYLSSGITLEFITDATSISFDYRVPICHSNDSIDVYINDQLSFVYKSQNLGKKGSICFNLDGQKNKVVLYFPIDSQVNIKNLVINGSYKSLPKRKSLLWIGDSITQGYGSELSSFCYLNVANRQLGYEVLNQGIGGYYFDEEIIQKMEGYYPEKIIVAFGTNQFRSADYYDRVKLFFDNIEKFYPNVPTLAILPIWRGDLGEEMCKKLYESNIKIKEIISRYSQVKIVDGFKLVPNVKEMFIDALHPNSLGAKIYADNLVKAIKQLKF